MPEFIQPKSVIRSGARSPLADDIVQTTKSYLTQHIEPLRRAGLAGRGGSAHAQQIARVFDGLLSAYFTAARSRIDHTRTRPMSVALLAVGGYGRGQLATGSDLDLVILTPTLDDPDLETLAESFLYPLWDTGVQIGHAVRTPDELVRLAREDLRTATTILDARHIGGDTSLSERALTQGWRVLFDGNVNLFLDALDAEMVQRHQRFGASVYLLEPDIKHGRGALRDLDIARWALRARYRCADVREALQRGAIAPEDAHRLDDAADYFWRVRGVLHARAGRRSDRLTFDGQEECARALGYLTVQRSEDLEQDDDLGILGAATERVMQTYYRHARNVATTLDRILEGCRSRPTHGALRTERVGDGVERFDGQLTFIESDALKTEPLRALQIIELAARTSLPLAGRARQMIARQTTDPHWCERLRARPGSGALFVRLVALSQTGPLRNRGTAVSVAEHACTSVLGEMHDLGLLLAMIPEFGPVTGRVHHDIYHVYTVDVHSVAAVDRLHQLARGELDALYGTPRRILASLERRDLVCLATLLHDIGKGRRKDHSIEGAEIAEQVCARLGLAAEQTSHVSWMVRQHLALYHVATRRDLSDAATIEQTAGLVGDPWRLRALYLLTIADLSTTSPTAMTSWKAQMLESLLRITEQQFLQATAEPAHRSDALIADALALATSEHRATVSTHIASLPARYLLATPPQAIVRHALLLAQAPLSRPWAHVTRIEGSASDLSEVVVVADDQPGLLARWSAVLFANRLDIQSAQVYLRARLEGGWEAVDVFTVRMRDGDPRALERLSERLPIELCALPSDDRGVLQRVSARAQEGLRRPEPPVRTEVEITNEASGLCTVIEVFGRDRPGLLFSIAWALYRLGLTIALAKVNTEGRRAADVFYVTELDGSKLAESRFEPVRRSLLSAVDVGLETA